jgi:hypothetical protein
MQGGIAQKNATLLRESSKVTGELTVADRSASGRKTGIVFGVTGPSGGMSSDPSVSFAYWVRRKMRPIRVAPTEVRDGEGRLIARIVVDPVTGQRRREPVDAL